MKTSHLDGWLYVAVAVCAFLTGALGSDEATKLISPEYLFKLKTLVGALGAAALAGKMYRSTTFATAQAASVSDTKTTTVTEQTSEVPPTITDAMLVNPEPKKAP